MPSISVTSEIGALRGVLVHTPGRELEAVTPGNREDFLYDDLIGLEVSAREHARLKAVLCRFATVHEIGDLLVEVLDRPDAREYLISRTMDVVPSEPLAQQLSKLPARAIVKMIIEGTEEIPGPIANTLARACSGARSAAASTPRAISSGRPASSAGTCAGRVATLVRPAPPRAAASPARRTAPP